MTQIISCITKDYVIQVSDRRLVYVNADNSAHVADDEANKAVLFCNRAVFGYTGLAQLEGKRTDYWIVSTITGHESYSDACNALAENATACFARFGPEIRQEWREHAFVSVGWTTSVEEPVELRPIVVLVSNTVPSNHNPNEQESPNEVIVGKFTVRYGLLPRKETLYLYIAGQPLEHQSEVELKRTLRKVIRKQCDPKAIALVIAYAMRECARNNPMVGSNLMVSCIPKAAVRIPAGEFVIVSALPNRNTSTFLHLTRNFEGISYGPHFVCGGAAAIDWRGSSLP